jgi:hypothetical protein
MINGFFQPQDVIGKTGCVLADTVVGKALKGKILFLIMPLQRGSAYCFAAVCQLVCWFTKFLFIFFAEVAHTDMKFAIQINHKNI